MQCHSEPLLRRSTGRAVYAGQHSAFSEAISPAARENLGLRLGSQSVTLQSPSEGADHLPCDLSVRVPQVSVCRFPSVALPAC